MRNSGFYYSCVGAAVSPLVAAKTGTQGAILNCAGTGKRGWVGVGWLLCIQAGASVGQGYVSALHPGVGIRRLNGLCLLVWSSTPSPGQHASCPAQPSTQKCSPSPLPRTLLAPAQLGFRWHCWADAAPSVAPGPAVLTGGPWIVSSGSVHLMSYFIF